MKCWCKSKHLRLTYSFLFLKGLNFRLNDNSNKCNHQCHLQYLLLLSFKFSFTGEDPGFFLGGGDVTDGEVKKIKGQYVDTKKKASSQGGGVRTPCTLPLDPPLFYTTFVQFSLSKAIFILVAILNLAVKVSK